MVNSLRALLVISLFLCIAWLPACDSSDNGGGGTTPTAGYSQADLAGRWDFVKTGLFAGKGYLVIDANGNITEAVIRWEGNPAPSTYILGGGSFTVSPDGKVRGDFSLPVNYSPPAGSYVIWVRGFRLRFTSAAKVEGPVAIAQAVYPGGVYLTRVSFGTDHISMQKQ